MSDNNKKIFMIKKLIVVCMLFTASIARAQEPRFHLQISPELALPAGDFSSVVKTGFGANAKGMYLLKTRDYATFTVGYQYFRVKSLVVGVTPSYNIVPLLIGYRKTYKKLFIESQVGLGFYTLNAKSTTSSATISYTGFTWAQSIGHDFGSLELQLRYQQGNFNKDHVGMFGLGLNYHFSFK